MSDYKCPVCGEMEKITTVYGYNGKENKRCGQCLFSDITESFTPESNQETEKTDKQCTCGSRKFLGDFCQVCGKYLTERNQEAKAKLNLNELAKEIHENAINHGWWEEERSFGEIIALCHSELSEALEAYRNKEEMIWDNNGKPDGIAVELADCIIRILDYCAYAEIDVEKAILLKHEYNKTRPYKHGGKVI